ncbi:MAG TPA: SIS domain-containing protein, partial [Vicinamibacteria bacterium]
MTLFENELREQPAVLARLLERGRPAAEKVADAVRRRDLRFAVLAARGSSDNAARYGQYLLGIRNSLVAALATPSAFTQYGAAPSLAGALVVGISQSGQSPDIVEVLRQARGQGAPTVAVTNVADSPLASAAEHVLVLHAGEERAVAATKTYTA